MAEKRKILEVKHLKKYFPLKKGKFKEGDPCVKAVDDITFDLYEGENVKENEKSLAISLTFEDKEKTLETADVDKIINSILNRLDALLHAHLR